jgi:hypothetical protein
LKIKLSILLFLLNTALYSGTWSNITINKQTLLLFHDDYDEYGSNGKTVTFYKKDKNKNKILLFSLILKDTTGGCNDKSIEEGTYEINGSTITLYSLWERVGSIEDAPYGGRVKRYQIVDGGGEVKLLSSQLYIESHTKDYSPDNGMRFLFISPTNIEEKKEFLSYLNQIEKFFKGTFIFEDNATKLIKEVNSALKRSIKAQWKR